MCMYYIYRFCSSTSDLITPPLIATVASFKIFNRNPASVDVDIPDGSTIKIASRTESQAFTEVGDYSIKQSGTKDVYFGLRYPKDTRLLSITQGTHDGNFQVIAEFN